MSNKKRLGALAVALSMMFSLVACGSTGQSSSQSSAGSQSSGSQSEAETPESTYPLNNQGGIGPAEAAMWGRLPQLPVPVTLPAITVR